MGLGGGGAGRAGLRGGWIEALVYKIVYNVERSQAFDANDTDDAFLRRGRRRQSLQLELHGLRQLSQRGRKIPVVVLIYGGKLHDKK
jgi:hypothetical protein